MKKILLGTTALLMLAAGAASAQQVNTRSPFTVSLGGSIRADWGFVDDDQADSSDYESRLDYRLTLKADAKAENGLNYGFFFRMRNNQNSGNNSASPSNVNVIGADYKYIYLGGGWGQVTIGDNHGATTELETLIPTVGIGGVMDAAGVFYNAGAYTGGYWASEGVIQTGIMYVTPSFSGFQAAISFAPEFGDAGRNIRRPEAAGSYSDALEIAAMYKGNFSGVGLQVSGGYSWADEKRANVADFGVFNFGAQVSYAGFTFGGLYYNQDETGGGREDQYGWGLGLTYTTGPWAVGVGYARTGFEVGRNDVTDYTWGFSGAYTLAPGLRLMADLNFFDIESSTVSRDGNEGTQLMLRTRLDF